MDAAKAIIAPKNAPYIGVSSVLGANVAPETSVGLPVSSVDAGTEATGVLLLDDVDDEPELLPEPLPDSDPLPLPDPFPDSDPLPLPDPFPDS
ncbi:MAG: hypothetical protein J6Z35_07565, partial [Lachnospiraceae bacterium]|nr:hypothetical protein [Lachnospiraceae bacterium]